ncbi:MAG: TIR domain-containing protein [Lachnospiraceae bacterium]|nr:TIR domain-containing protein [Lachnospiraceae bacterium]
MEKTVHHFKTVFISWNHLDQELKNQVCTYLEKELGINCVWESDEDCSGNITEACMGAIQAASAVVVLITENSVKSSWVSQEVEYAMKVHGLQYVVPILLMKTFPTHSPFSDLLQDHSGIVHMDETLSLEEMELKQIRIKTVTAINEHCFRNYCENDYLFHTTISVDCVAEDINTRCDLSSIWINRTVTRLNERYADEEQIDSQEEMLGKGPVLLVGEAGCGKSLMMQSLIQKLMSRKEKPLVFYISLKDLNYQEEENLFSSLFRIFQTHCDGLEYSPAMFRSLLHLYKDNVWIFFDGIDEIIADHDKQCLQNQICSFYSETGCNRNHAFFSSRNLSDAEFVQKGLSLNPSALNCCRIEKNE